ncbi:hypothetical protein ACFQ07_27470 [Actinomadura adrarensis]|uniref:Endonuclease/exonuclease/phosphatase family protein n=1 Tax=Actinomadura adrarensis TaxID=1819600 RepID=A0ABW3CNB1_9ACTN
MADTWTIMSLNTERGGMQDRHGRPENRWPQLSDLIAEVRPHILLAQELLDWKRHPSLRYAAQRALRRRGWPMQFEVPDSHTGSHNAIAYQPNLLEPVRGEEHYGQFTQSGFAVLVLAPVDSDEDAPGFTAISAHLSAFSAQVAVQEAQYMVARLHRYGGIGVIGGDINHVPLGDPEPDWNFATPYNRSSRCVPISDPGEPLHANREVGRTLLTAGLIEVAGHLADTTGRHDHYRHQTGRTMRPDQFHITPNLKDALSDYERHPTASDHDAIVMHLDPTQFGSPTEWF